jgi:nucleoside-diphosphate-sugar epimerase
LSELLSAIGDAAGRRVEPTFGPRRAGDIAHSHADITLARQALGYEPVVSFHEGIARTVAWYRERMTERAAHMDLSPDPDA